MFDISEDNYLSCGDNTTLADPQQLQNSCYQGDTTNGTNISISAIISASCVLVDGTDYNNIHNHHPFTSHVTPQQPLHHQPLTSHQQNNFLLPAWAQTTSGPDRPKTQCLNIPQERVDFNFCPDRHCGNIFPEQPENNECQENQKFNSCCREFGSFDCQFENGPKTADNCRPIYPHNNGQLNKNFDSCTSDFGFDSSVDVYPVANSQTERKTSLDICQVANNQTDRKTCLNVCQVANNQTERIDFASGQYLSPSLHSILREGQHHVDDVNDAREFERDFNMAAWNQYGGTGETKKGNPDEESTLPHYQNIRNRQQYSRHMTPAPTLTSPVSMVENLAPPLKTAPSTIETTLPMNAESSQILPATSSETEQMQTWERTSGDQIQMAAPTTNMSPSTDDRAWMEGPVVAPELNSTLSCKIDIDVDHMLSKGVTVAGYKPRPIIRKKRKKAVVQEQKNVDYWNRRIKNNDSARKSREAKKEKERIFYKQALQLEYENYFLKVKISQLESQLGIAPSQPNVEVSNTGNWS